jgi:hypothetical protein
MKAGERAVFPTCSLAFAAAMLAYAASRVGGGGGALCCWAGIACLIFPGMDLGRGMGAGAARGLAWFIVGVAGGAALFAMGT